MVLHKLVNEKYIYHPDATHYMLTFDGKHFIEKGGYESEEKIKAINQEYQKRQSEVLKTYQRWIVIVIATVVAGMYYLLEVLKYFHILPSRL